MRAYRAGIIGVLAFALVYPAISGGVLILGNSVGVDEIYPFAPWALFCFVPNQEVDFGVRLVSIDGKPLEPRPPYEDYLKLDQSRESVGYALVQAMGQFAGGGDPAMLESQRQLFEQSFLRPIGQDVQYELFSRTFDVLDRWHTGECQRVESVDQFEFQAEQEGI